MKKYYVSAIIAALVFVIFLVGYDYFTKTPMSVGKYIFQGLFFGGGMTFLDYRTNRNVNKNEAHKNKN
jgi:hypothetical protein